MSEMDGLSPNTPQEVQQSFKNPKDAANIMLLARGAAADVWRIPASSHPYVRVCKVLRVTPLCFDEVSSDTSIQESYCPSWQTFVEEYLAQLRKWTPLNHRNIVKVFERESGDDLSLQVAFCENGCVRDYLKTPTGSVKKGSVILGVLSGLVYLHGQDPPIVHGNLNAGKIFVHKDGTVKLGEFGLAALCDPFSTLVPSILFVGASRWMSPELIVVDIGEPIIVAGDLPYAQFKHDIQVKRQVLSGTQPGKYDARIEAVTSAPLWSTIQSCWGFIAAGRPAASVLLLKVTPSTETRTPPLPTMMSPSQPKPKSLEPQPTALRLYPPPSSKVISTPIPEGNIQVQKQLSTRIGRCPPPSRVFTGRDGILDHMNSYFFKSESLERSLFVLHGLGGAGKTQLALKFVQLHKALFRDVFYIDATTRETISAGLTALAKEAEAGMTPEEALAWLVSREERWLLVLDNADDPNLNLHDFFPQCAHGDILITTRNQQMVAHTTGPESACRVGGMRPDDALQLLFKTSGADDKEEAVSTAKRLVEDLGYFALAIVHSGAYMRTRQCSVPEYFKILQIARARLLREHSSIQGANYQLSVFATWETNYRQLPPRATQLLHIMSFLHHEGISEAFFEAASVRAVSYEPEIPLTEFQSATKTIIFDFLSVLRKPSGEWDFPAFMDLINQLRAFSLVNYDTRSCSYSMHPLVQEWARTAAPDVTTVRECATWVLALCVSGELSSADYAFRRQLLPHLLALDSGDTQMVPELAGCLRWVYDEAGYAKEEEALLAIGLQASRDALGNEHPTTLAYSHNLAWALQQQGRLEETEMLLTEVIEVSKRVYGHEHPETLASMHNLALTYRDQERPQEAEVLFLEVVEARRRVTGAEHINTLRSLGMLASTYWSQRRLSKAEALQVEVLEMTMRLLGRQHPDSLSAMHNLASTYETQGKLREANSLMEETVVLDTQVYGEFHVKTRESIRYLEHIQQCTQLLVM